MKRLGLFLMMVGALIFVGGALPAWAQPPAAPAPIPGLSPEESQRVRDLIRPNFTVNFSGQMRIHGFVFDNILDFRDTTDTGGSKDSQAFYFQRFRLNTRIESADKKARAVWHVEVGDITWGAGGGASGTEFGGSTTRVGPGSGGELGNDGVNVETKWLYLQFDIPFVPGADILLGGHNILFLTGPFGAFLDDDAYGIQFNWKADPIDIQVWTAKVSENNRQDSDDNDLYALRFGFNVTKDLRFTVEGLIADTHCFTRPAAPGPTPGTVVVGPCLSADFGDNFWIGATVGAKFGTLSLDGIAVYGQRQLPCSVCPGLKAEENGFGVFFTARLPLGPVSTWWHAWYTTGDDQRQPGRPSNAANGLLPAVGGIAPSALSRDSDRLPIPVGGSSFAGAPFIAEYLFGNVTLGSPNVGQVLYSEYAGTWGIGASGIFALTPTFSLAGGLAYVAATEDNGIFGDNVVEIDAGAIWRLNPNLAIQAIAGYLIPDQGDNAWAAAFRTFFTF